MKILNKTEAEKILTSYSWAKNRQHNEQGVMILDSIMKLEVGEGLFVEPSEWTMKTKLGQYVGFAVKKDRPRFKIRNFKTRTAIESNQGKMSKKGWLITRIK